MSATAEQQQQKRSVADEAARCSWVSSCAQIARWAAPFRRSPTTSAKMTPPRSTKPSPASAPRNRRDAQTGLLADQVLPAVHALGVVFAAAIDAHSIGAQIVVRVVGEEWRIAVGGRRTRHHTGWEAGADVAAHVVCLKRLALRVVGATGEDASPAIARVIVFVGAGQTKVAVFGSAAWREARR